MAISQAGLRTNQLPQGHSLAWKAMRDFTNDGRNQTGPIYADSGLRQQMQNSGQNQNAYSDSGFRKFISEPLRR